MTARLPSISITAIFGTIKFLAENTPGLDGYWIGRRRRRRRRREGLTNDHPVGFDCDTVAVGPFYRRSRRPLRGQVQQEDRPWIRAAGNGELTYLNNTSGGITVADRLYVDPSDGSRYMTCATCHDVHNKKNMDRSLGRRPPTIWCSHRRRIPTSV